MKLLKPKAVEKAKFGQLSLKSNSEHCNKIKHFRLSMTGRTIATRFVWAKRRSKFLTFRSKVNRWKTTAQPSRTRSTIPSNRTRNSSISIIRDSEESWLWRRAAPSEKGPNSFAITDTIRWTVRPGTKCSMTQTVK